MLRNEVDRSKGQWTVIPRYIRQQVNRRACAICKREYGRVYTLEENKIRYPKQHIEHLIPRRWLAEHGLESHHVSNLLSVCNYCHAPKAKLEDRLYQGDVLSYLQGLKRLGYPVARIVNFALAMKLSEFGGISV